MDAIAAEAGISKPMVYNYFGSKEGIYLAYLARAGRDLLNRMLAADVPDGTLAERLEAGAGAFFGFVGENHDGWRVLREEMLSQREAVGGQVAAMRSAIHALLSEVLVEEGGDPGRVDAYAHALTGAGESLADWWLEHPGHAGRGAGGHAGGDGGRSRAPALIRRTDERRAGHARRRDRAGGGDRAARSPTRASCAATARSRSCASTAACRSCSTSTSTGWSARRRTCASTAGAARRASSARPPSCWSGARAATPSTAACA